MLLTKSATK